MLLRRLVASRFSELEATQHLALTMHDIPQPTNPKQIDRETRKTDRDKFVRMLKYAKFPHFAAFADSSRLRIRFAQNIVRKGKECRFCRSWGRKLSPRLISNAPVLRRLIRGDTIQIPGINFAVFENFDFTFKLCKL